MNHHETYARAHQFNYYLEPIRYLMTFTVWNFLISFFFLFVILTIAIVALVFRYRHNNDQENLSEMNQETIIVKEIVKIRCRYCGITFDQGLDTCPNCGART